MSKVQKRDLLAEIWKSKLSYCQIHNRDFIIPDVIVSDLREVTEPDLTIRLDTDTHIPKATTAAKGKHGHLKGQIGFAPFILYRSGLDSKGKLTFKEVARSHHRNGLFEPGRGRITPALARMMLTMVESYARKANFRGYSYIDEMQSEALLTLSMNILKFDESKSDNPHAYITQIIHTTFLRELKRQKRHADIRDRLLIDEGMKPSFSAQANK